MEFKDRLKKVINHTGLKNKDFSAICDLTKGQIQKYLNGSQEPKMVFFNHISENFPLINIEWLITGTGAIEKNTEQGVGDQIVKLKPVVEKHIDVVKQFDDHEAAVDINQDLVFIEKKSKVKFEKVRSYIKGMREGLEDEGEAGHQKKHQNRRKESMPIKHEERRKKVG